MISQKKIGPRAQDFEHVDWARYKSAMMTSTIMKFRPFAPPKATECLETGHGRLDLGKQEDRHLIRETQRHLRPGFSASLHGLFETTVAEAAAYLRSCGIGPHERDFPSMARSYAANILLELEAAEAEISRLMPRDSPVQRAFADAFLGKGSGGLKN